MLSILGSLGAPSELTTALAEMGGIEFHGADLNGLRFLRGPLIVHQSAWMDSIPDWMPRQAMMERHEIVFGDAPWIVGPTEIGAVMYPRTMEAPMRSDMTELYLWATATACARHYKKPIAKYWKDLAGQRPIPDKEVIVRGGRLWHEYSDLSHEIRRKVIAHQTGRDRESKRGGKPPPPPKGRQPKILGTQLNLFDIAA